MKYLFLEKKIILITKIPIRNDIDTFTLTRLLALPVKINNNFYRAKIENYLAIGKTYRTNVDYEHCQKYKDNLFCKSKSEYMGLNENDTCIGSILSGSNKLYEKCNFDKLERMEDTFINYEGTYYFSMKETRILELLCVNSMENDQIKLSGIGSIKIKINCYAKFKNLLLTGSNTFKLNGSYHISMLEEQTSYNSNFTFLSKDSIKNITITDFKINRIGRLDTNLINTEPYFHLIAIYIYILIIITCITIIVVLYCKNKSKVKQIILDRILHSNTQSKVASTSSAEASTSSAEDNQIPFKALKEGKKSKRKSNKTVYIAL